MFRTRHLFARLLRDARDHPPGYSEYPDCPKVPVYELHDLKTFLFPRFSGHRTYVKTLFVQLFATDVNFGRSSDF